jgi:hypothetical protein
MSKPVAPSRDAREQRRDEHVPIACTLSPETLQTRRAALLPGLFARSDACEAVPDGYRIRFAASAEMLIEIAHTIEAERQCCRFLRFVVTVEPADGPIAVEVTGPAGTREFLDALLHDGSDRAR